MGRESTCCGTWASADALTGDSMVLLGAEAAGGVSTRKAGPGEGAGVMGVGRRDGAIWDSGVGFWEGVRSSMSAGGLLIASSSSKAYA